MYEILDAFSPVQPGYRPPSPADLTSLFSRAPQALHPSLMTMILLHLEYVRHTEWSAKATKQQAEQEWKLFDAVYTEGNKVWQGSPESGWLGRALRKMAENLLHLAFRVSSHSALVYMPPRTPTHIRTSVSQSATLSRDKRFTAPSVSVDRIRRTFQIATISEWYVPPDLGSASSN